MEENDYSVITLTKIQNIRKFCQILTKNDMRIILNLLSHKYNGKFVFFPGNFLANLCSSYSKFSSNINELLDMGIIKRSQAQISIPVLKKDNIILEQQIFDQRDSILRKRSLYKLVSNKFKFDFTKDRSFLDGSLYTEKSNEDEIETIDFGNISLSSSPPKFIYYFSKKHGTYLYFLLNILRNYRLISFMDISFEDSKLNKKTLNSIKRHFNLPLSSRTLNYKDYSNLGIFNIEYIKDELGNVTLNYGAKYSGIMFKFDTMRSKGGYQYQEIPEGYVAIQK